MTRRVMTGMISEVGRETSFKFFFCEFHRNEQNFSPLDCGSKSGLDSESRFTNSRSCRDKGRFTNGDIRNLVKIINPKHTRLR